LCTIHHFIKKLGEKGKNQKKSPEFLKKTGLEREKQMFF